MAGSGAETHRKMGRKVRKTGYAPRAPLQTASKIVPPVLPFCTISRTGNYERSDFATIRSYSCISQLRIVKWL